MDVVYHPAVEDELSGLSDKDPKGFDRAVNLAEERLAAIEQERSQTGVNPMAREGVR
jgi:hypothetical protein